jgi:hypothetical protein|tara:strand:+ start:406 stop:606 length:201 start_codon:yes stop_codon:yes gene_type:complete
MAKGKKIRVNVSNSKVVDGRLFISLLKAQQVTSKVLKSFIEYGNSVVFPGGNRFVEYKGAYIRVNS